MEGLDWGDPAYSLTGDANIGWVRGAGETGIAGSSGVNPAMIDVSAVLILAWRNAGYIGLDRWVLPALGTPWHREAAFDRDRPARDRTRDTSVT